MFGRLTDPTAGAFHALAHEPIVLYTCIAIVVIGLVAVVALTALGWWGFYGEIGLQLLIINALVLCI